MYFGLSTPVTAHAVVHACVQARVLVCARVCPTVRARTPGPLGPALGALRPRVSSRAGAGHLLGRAVGPLWGCAQTRAAPALCVPRCGCRRRGHHFLLREGQAHKREGGCSPSPSSFPQMPSAAGLLLQYGPRRLSPRPWLAAGLCSALAAFMLGTPPNRLLRLLICLKSSHTSRQRSPRGREKRDRVCARCAWGRGRGSAPVCGPLCPPGAWRAQWGRRGARGAHGAGCRGARASATRRWGPRSPIPAE